MAIEAHDLVLILLARETTVMGRTLLQKKVYFLNELVSGNVRYFPHFYGPYSRDVAETVDFLVSAGTAKERAESFPGMQTPWGESTRYSYSVSDGEKDKIGKIVKKRIGKSNYDKIVNALNKIDRLPGAQNYKALSVAAKVFQILKEKGKMKLSDFPKEAKALNWKISQSEVGNAADFLEKLGLLKKA